MKTRLLTTVPPASAASGATVKKATTATRRATSAFRIQVIGRRPLARYFIPPGRQRLPDRQQILISLACPGAWRNDELSGPHVGVYSADITG
jgi:hypothetical protein